MNKKWEGNKKGMKPSRLVKFFKPVEKIKSVQNGNISKWIENK